MRQATVTALAPGDRQVVLTERPDGTWVGEVVIGLRREPLGYVLPPQVGQRWVLAWRAKQEIGRHDRG